MNPKIDIQVQIEKLKAFYNDTFFDDKGNMKEGELTFALLSKKENVSFGHFDLKMKSSDTIKSIPIGEILFGMKDHLEKQLNQLNEADNKVENITPKNEIETANDKIISDAIIIPMTKEVEHRGNKYTMDDKGQIKNKEGKILIKSSPLKSQLLKLFKAQKNDTIKD